MEMTVNNKRLVLGTGIACLMAVLMSACGDDAGSSAATEDTGGGAADASLDTSEPSDATAADTTLADTASEDTAAQADTTSPDTTVVEDAAEDTPEDTALDDTASEDTTPTDTEVADSDSGDTEPTDTTEDTSPEDTTPEEDTGLADSGSEDSGDDAERPTAPSLAIVEVGVEERLLDVWAEHGGRVLIAGDVPVQIQDGVVSWWPPSANDIRRTLAVTGGPTRGTTFVTEYRPGILARYANAEWRSVRFALEYRFTHISMREYGSREVVVASGPTAGLIYNGSAQDRQSGWQSFFANDCPGEEGFNPRPDPCPIDSSFLIGGEFERETWLSFEGRLMRVVPSVPGDIINEEVEGVAYDIFALDDGSVFTAGPAGELHWKIDGVWSSLTHPSARDLRGVWASSASDAWAVGDGGLVLWFDGAGWRTIASGTDANLNAVHGAEGQLWIVGDGGTLLWAGGDDDTPPAGQVLVPEPPDRDPAVRFISVDDGAVLLACGEGNQIVGNNLDHVGNASGRFVSGYHALDPGAHRYWVEVFGANGCIGLTSGAVNLDLEVNDTRTLIVESAVNSVQDYVTFSDDLTPPEEYDNVRVRFMHFAHELEGMERVELCRGATLVANLGRHEASEYIELAADAAMVLRAPADPTCEGEIIHFVRPEFEQGRAHTVILMRGNSPVDGEHLAVLTCVDGVDNVPEAPSSCSRTDLPPR